MYKTGARHCSTVQYTSGTYLQSTVQDRYKTKEHMISFQLCQHFAGIRLRLTGTNLLLPFGLILSLTMCLCPVLPVEAMVMAPATTAKTNDLHSILERGPSGITALTD